MSRRVAVSALLATGVAAGLFTLMSLLIATDPTPPQDELATRPLDFVRVKREPELRTKERRLPAKTEPARTPPRPELRVGATARPEPVAPPIGEIGLAVGDLGAPIPGTVLSDMDVVPLVRVPPQYPQRAARRGIGGWVLLEFTVTAAGTVEDARVLDSEPAGTFDRSALRAVERFKYRPRIEHGRPVERPGVRIVISFEPDAPSS